MSGQKGGGGGPRRPRCRECRLFLRAGACRSAVPWALFIVRLGRLTVRPSRRRPGCIMRYRRTGAGGCRPVRTVRTVRTVRERAGVRVGAGLCTTIGRIRPSSTAPARPASVITPRSVTVPNRGAGSGARYRRLFK